MDTPNTKPAQVANLMRAVAAGSVGWWTFNAYCRHREAYSEYYLYSPVLEIAMAQGWSVKREYQLRKGVRGKPPSIDFVFENEDRIVGLEVKWVGTKGKRRRQLDLKNELKKLKELKHRNPNSTVDGFLMILGLASLFDPKNPKVRFSPSRLNVLLCNQGSLWAGAFLIDYKTPKTHWAALIMRVSQGDEPRPSKLGIS